MTDITTAGQAARAWSLAAGGEVDIFLTSSTLRLRGTDGDQVVVRSHDGSALHGAVAIEAEPGAIRIRDGVASALRIGPIVMHTGRSPDLDVDVPRTARVAVRTASGDVRAVGIGGASRWGTASGTLLLALDGGPASIESTSGGVTVDAARPLDLAIRSVSGDLRLKAPLFSGLNVATTSGDVEVDGALADRATHVITSVSGDVRLVTGTEVRVETQTVTGDVLASVPHRAEGGRGRRTIVVGAGRATIAVRTLSGDVLLQAPSSPASRPAQLPVAVPDAPAPEPASPAPVPGRAADPDEHAVVVAEAEAASNLIRPHRPAPGPELGSAGPHDDRERARLDILRALERGELDVDAASRRLESIDAAGPSAFRRSW
jgi:hypothetical protein